jgi:hypothetical protein
VIVRREDDKVLGWAIEMAGAFVFAGRRFMSGFIVEIDGGRKAFSRADFFVRYEEIG